MGRIGAGLLKQSKTAQEDDKRPTRRDILSLLIRANTMQDLPAVQRMDDEQVMARAYKPILKIGVSTHCTPQRSPLSLSPDTKQLGTHISLPRHLCKC